MLYFYFIIFRVRLLFYNFEDNRGGASSEELTPLNRSKDLPLAQLNSKFFSRIRAERIIVLNRRRICTMFDYNPNEIKWAKDKPAEHNPKQRLAGV
jgi:hypothetical protein